MFAATHAYDSRASEHAGDKQCKAGVQISYHGTHIRRGKIAYREFLALLHGAQAADGVQPVLAFCHSRVGRRDDEDSEGSLTPPHHVYLLHLQRQNAERPSATEQNILQRTEGEKKTAFTNGPVSHVVLGCVLFFFSWPRSQHQQFSHVLKFFLRAGRQTS